MKETATTAETATQNVLIGQIQISGNNPRKTFNEKELGELSESIRNIGVLQPILVRPVQGELELVCGERRLRASKLAGLETIPVFVKEMSDSEAFEAMIIENLERKDVHPLEESDGFRRMLESGKYTVSEIAHKFVKTDAYIAQRLKLNDLIDAIKQDFYADMLTIGQAVQVAKQTAENQEELYRNYKDNYVDGYGNLRELKEYIEDYQLRLSEAKFNIEEENILPGLCSCTVCPKRSGANPLLFSDIDNADTCIDSACFELKASTVIRRTIVGAIESGEEHYFLNDGYSLQDDVIELLNEYGFPVLRENYDYRHSESEGYEEKKGIIVAGRDIGKTQQIFIRVETQNDAEHQGSESGASFVGVSAETDEIAEKIVKIQKRAVRDLELDQEKITVKISENYREILKGELSGGFPTDEKFLNDVVFYIALSKVGLYNTRRWIVELGIDAQITEAKTVEELQSELSKITTDERMKLLVRMIYSEYHSYTPNSQGAAILRNCLGMHPANSIASILENQKAITDKRIMRKDERIADLLKLSKQKLPKNIDTIESIDTAETVESIETIESIDTAETVESIDTIESIDTAETKESIDTIESIETAENDAPVFEKVSKKYSLNRSYFKNLKNGYPKDVAEAAIYLKQHGELPFEYSGSNWVYDAFIEYQKLNGVHHSQYFTPDATAARMSLIAIDNFPADAKVLDACSGFGQLSKPLSELGYTIDAVDASHGLVDVYNSLGMQNAHAECILFEEFQGEYQSIISNPPHEIPAFTAFLEKCLEIMPQGGRLVLLISKGMLDKSKPKKLFQAVSSFTILSREDMGEPFGLTSFVSEIAVLQKN